MRKKEAWRDACTGYEVTGMAGTDKSDETLWAWAEKRGKGGTQTIRGNLYEPQKLVDANEWNPIYRYVRDERKKRR